MKLSENRRLAFVVLAVVIAVSIVVQGSVAMQNRRGDIEVLFMEGEMHELMTRCAEQAVLIGQMATPYLADGALAQYCPPATAQTLQSGGYSDAAQQLEPLAQQLRQAPDPNACLAAFEQLTAAVEKTYTGVDMLDLTDGQMRDIKLAYYNYTGGMDLVSRDGDNARSYTAKAKIFNHDLIGFPANLFARALHVEPLTTYGG